MATEGTQKVVVLFARELKAAAVALKEWETLCDHGTEEQNTEAAAVMLAAVAAALHGVADAKIESLVLSHADPIQLVVKTEQEATK